MSWSLGTEDEYEKLVIRMNQPKVGVDNQTCATATIIKVNCVRREGILLEIVQVLSDLDLCIRKSYISSDGQWFMAIFYVTCLRSGCKLLPQDQYLVISKLNKGLCSRTSIPNSCQNDYNNDKNKKMQQNHETHQTGRSLQLELTGIDRQDILSDVLRELTDLRFKVIDARVWTHKSLFVAVISITNLQDDHKKPESTDNYDSHRHTMLEARLRDVLLSNLDSHVNKYVSVLLVAPTRCAAIHPERRLHQMMASVMEFQTGDEEGNKHFSSPRADVGTTESPLSPTCVKVQDWAYSQGYYAVTVQCRDHPKLLFDVACALSDSGFDVCHGSTDVCGDQASHEFYVRVLLPSSSSSCHDESELPQPKLLVQCVREAIDRRETIKGTRLELFVDVRLGFTADMTKPLADCGLTITNACFSTIPRIASSRTNSRLVLYVSGSTGENLEHLDATKIQVLSRRIGSYARCLTVNDDGCLSSKSDDPFQPKAESNDVKQWLSATLSSNHWAGGTAVTVLGLLTLGNLLVKNMGNLRLVSLTN